MAKRTEKEESETDEKSSADASPEDEDASREEEGDERSEEESDDSEERDAEEEDASEDDDEEDDEDEEDRVAAKSASAKSASGKSTSEKSAGTADEDEDEDEDGEELAEKPALAAREGEDGEEEVVLPTQLGTQRYIFAAYLTGGMLVAYVLGRAIHGVWSHYANRDFFVSAVPTLAAVSDDGKQTYSTVLAGVLTLLFLVRTYRKPDVRQWTEEVTTEMTKCVWPTRKEVTNSTIVVITASAIATAYLFLLDRLWAFVTGLVYGAGT